MKTDMEIQQDVLGQLRWHPILNAARIGVSVRNGIVTLYGQVESYAQKLAAEKAVHKVKGVRALAEDIQIGVSPEKINDFEIAEAISDAFKLHIAIPRELIRVTVDEGIVSLEGEVDADYQRKEAYQLVSGLKGVRMIFNQLTIKPDVPVEGIENLIREALKRTSSIDPKSISASVEGNKVKLHGKVLTHANIEEVEEAAWSIQGVSEVENHLKLITEEELEC